MAFYFCERKAAYGNQNRGNLYYRLRPGFRGGAEFHPAHLRRVYHRMGIPYKPKGVSVICLAVDAPMDIINGLTGKIGRLPGVSAKAAYSAKA